MTNMYIPTKGGELLRLKRELARAGFSVPPMRIVTPPFEAKHGEIEAAVAHFRKMTSNRGPFPPGLMVRNNGSPTGTGKGHSGLLLLDEPPERVVEAANYSHESDKDARGVILQLPVGQAMGSSYQHFLPILAGIAYTAPASVRGNAEIQWVPGHAAMAVAGLGEYVAFNGKSIGYEMKNTQLVDWKVPSMNDTRRPFVGYITYDEKRNKYSTAGGAWAADTLNELVDIGPKLRKSLKERLFQSVLKLGGAGPLYLEWAMTCIGGKINLFALQVAEYAEKRAGLRTEVKKWTENFGNVLKEARLAKTREETALEELYEKAAQDERVIFAGFDVVGHDRREFDTLVWTTDRHEAWRQEGRNIAIVYSCESGAISAGGPKVGGLVEERHGDVHTFRAHMEGYCDDEDIVGIGTVEDMSSKLLTLYPEKFNGVFMASIVMKGRFTMDVNAGIPFGTLKVDGLDSVEKLRRE
ncbi:MAG: hypothetical protein WC263_02230 [Candidatus Micrarchaeia archaeon]